MEGFLELKGPIDLLEKLRHDMRLLEKDPMDTYLAFNFFVTAEHLADWLYPGFANSAALKQFRKGSLLLQMCSHLANGIKHFRAEAKHHKSVSGATKRLGAFGNAFGNVYGSVFGRGISIQLDGDAKQQYGEEINAVVLARHVLNFWELKLQPPSN